jgi:hypothetical protein
MRGRFNTRPPGLHGPARFRWGERTRDPPQLGLTWICLDSSHVPTRAPATPLVGVRGDETLTPPSQSLDLLGLTWIHLDRPSPKERGVHAASTPNSPAGQNNPKRSGDTLRFGHWTFGHASTLDQPRPTGQPATLPIESLWPCARACSHKLTLVGERCRLVDGDY